MRERCRGPCAPSTPKPCASSTTSQRVERARRAHAAIAATARRSPSMLNTASVGDQLAPRTRRREPRFAQRRNVVSAIADEIGAREQCTVVQARMIAGGRRRPHRRRAPASAVRIAQVGRDSQTGERERARVRRTGGPTPPSALQRSCGAKCSQIRCDAPPAPTPSVGACGDARPRHTRIAGEPQVVVARERRAARGRRRRRAPRRQSERPADAMRRRCARRRSRERGPELGDQCWALSPRARSRRVRHSGAMPSSASSARSALDVRDCRSSGACRRRRSNSRRREAQRLHARRSAPRRPAESRTIAFGIVMRATRDRAHELERIERAAAAVRSGVPSTCTRWLIGTDSGW